MLIFSKILTIEFRLLLLSFANHENEVERSNWLLGKIREAYVPPFKIFRFFVLGREVCAEGWRFLHGCKQTRFYQVRKKYLLGIVVIIHGNADREYLHPKNDLVKHWIIFSAEMYCEFMPHLNLLYLPYAVDKSDWFSFCIESLKTKWKVQPDELPKKSYFLQILREKFPFIHVCRHIVLGRCDLCILLKMITHSEAVDKETKEIKKKELEAHRENVFLERDVYNEIKDSARDPSRNMLSIVLDKASGPRLPHVAEYPKSWATKIRPKTHIFGFINHTTGLKVLIPHMSNFADDPNLAISLLLNELDEFAKECIRENTPLPENCHLQLDSCFKENKNRWALGFQAVVVGLGIFKKVTCDFLPKGHTHIDVDAMFNGISDGTKYHDCYAWSGFKRFLDKCYHKHHNKPIVRALPVIYDWKSWFEPVLRDFTGLSKFRCFMVEALNCNIFPFTVSH